MKKLGFGCMRLPLTNPEDQGSVDVEQIEKMFDYFLANGYTYFDTAYFYHDKKSEMFVRDHLVKRHPRDSFTITTKLPISIIEKEEEVEEIFNSQLERLGVEFFDYYWIHGIREESYIKAEKLNCFEFIKAKKEAGLIKHLGFSYHGKADLLEEILTKHPEIEYVQLQLNYLDWESPSVQGRLNYEVCTKHNVPVVVMEPVKGGKLASLPEEAENNFKALDPNASNASFALRYIAELDNVLVILSGMSNMDQLLDNVKTFNDLKPLSDEEKKVINDNILIIKKSNRIPCTACRYCAVNCPMNIPIPEYFDILNSNSHRAKQEYDSYSEKGYGKASVCIECGQCENMCPQGIEIRSFLKEAVEKFES